MSRGPGRVERIVEAALSSADRSYSVDELAQLAYPGLNRVEKKHRVAVLRTLSNVNDRTPLWYWTTHERRGRYFISNMNRVRSYAHGKLRRQWWGGRQRSLDNLDEILADPEIQLLMEQGGMWWTEVEINKADYEIDLLRRAAGVPRNGINATPSADREIAMAKRVYDLRRHRADLAMPHEEVDLFGRFEPPDTRIFEYAMKIRAGEKSSSDNYYLTRARRLWGVAD